MSQIPWLFVAACLFGVVLASVSVWSPRRTSTKWFAVAITALFLPLAYASFTSLLSKPKPIALEWWMDNQAEANVLGSTIEEGEGIFLWLQLGGVSEPRSYVLPWDRELAEQLQQALREAEEQQSGVRMRMPFEPSLDNRRPRFYALPQPALPSKPMPDSDGPMIFDPSTEA